MKAPLKSTALFVVIFKDMLVTRLTPPFEDIDTVRCRHHIVFCTHSLLVTLGFRIENLRDADRVVEEKEVNKVIDGKEVSELSDYHYLNFKPQGSDF